MNGKRLYMNNEVAWFRAPNDGCIYGPTFEMITVKDFEERLNARAFIQVT